MSAPFDNTIKERIRDAADIVEIVGQYIPLHRQGSNYVGRCPWHDDTRPSLQVNPQRQTFKCWVCDIGGDVFAFVMKMENADFREALQILADKTGITLPQKTGGGYLSSAANGGEEMTRKQLLEAAAGTAKLYHHELLHSEEAAAARNYLAKRNIDAAAIEKFNIGYAPVDRHWLSAKVKHKTEKIRMLELIGNFRAAAAEDSQKRTARSDFFRGRLIFPIRDEQGRTVAFGGRLIPGSPLADDAWHKDRKYLNSPETPLFSKHKILYGLDAAKPAVKEKRRTLITEGYTDCITAHQFGFTEAVAVLGTALGPAHIRLLNRMGAEKIILMLDGDRAGQAKAESDKVLTDFIAQGADMSVLTLPDGLDPAEFLEQYGADALNTLLQTETVNALEHIFRTKTRGIDLKDMIPANNALDSILEIVANAPLEGTSPNDPVRFRIEKTLQNLFVRFVMPEETIRRRFREKQRKASGALSDPLADSGQTGNAFRQQWTPDALPDLLERNMLELWLADPTAIYEFWEQEISPEQFRSPLTQQIYHLISELVEQRGKPATFENILTGFDDLPMKNFLVELDFSARKKFFADEENGTENGLENARRTELTKRWEEPAFKELRKKLIAELVGALAKRESVRQRKEELDKLRSNSLSDEEKLQQLLNLQKKLRGKN